MIKTKILKWIRVLDFLIHNPTKINLLKKNVLNVYNSGIYYTLEFEMFYLKLPNKKRQKEIKKNWELIDLMKFNSLEIIRDKFYFFNNRPAHIIKNNIFQGLVLKKIDAKPLSCFFHSKEFLFLIEKSFIKLKQNKIPHADFHLENILIDKENNIYFIDFDYEYLESVKFKTESDILKFLYFFKKYYFKEFEFYKDNLKKLIFKYFDKNNLLEAKKNMQKYLQGNLDEFFD